MSTLHVCQGTPPKGNSLSNRIVLIGDLAALLESQVNVASDSKYLEKANLCLLSSPLIATRGLLIFYDLEKNPTLNGCENKSISLICTQLATALLHAQLVSYSTDVGKCCCIYFSTKLFQLLAVCFTLVDSSLFPPDLYFALRVAWQQRF